VQFHLGSARALPGVPRGTILQILRLLFGVAAAIAGGSYNRFEARNARAADTIQTAAEVIASALPEISQSGR